MLSVSDRHLAQQLAANNAIIIRTKRADAYPAYAYGDRRKRPLRWVSDESFRCLTSFGGLDSKGAGYSVSKSGSVPQPIAAESRSYPPRSKRPAAASPKTIPAQAKAMLARKTMRARAQIKRDMMAALRTRR